MAELKPCPFCGGEATTHYQPLYTEKGVCVFCVECKARSRFFLGDCKYTFYHGEKNVYISMERATSDAIEAWNRRSESKERIFTQELEFTRQFIHEHGLEFALAEAWNRRVNNE